MHLFLGQIKSVSRNGASTHNHVLHHPYENVYNYAVKQCFEPKGYTVDATVVLFKYLKAKVPNIPKLFIETVILDRNIQDRALEGIAVTLDEMEKYANGAEAPRYTNSCIDWMTGQPCAYANFCFTNITDAEVYDYGFAKPANRYPEFDGIELSGKTRPLEVFPYKMPLATNESEDEA